MKKRHLRIFALITSLLALVFLASLLIFQIVHREKGKENKNQAPASGSKESYLNLISSLKGEIGGNPNDPEKRYELAQAYFYVEKYDEALLELDRAAELSREDRAMLSKIYTLKATIYREQSNRESEDEFLRAIAENPQNLLPYLNLAVLYRGERKYNEAISVLKKGISANPKSKELYLQLARIYQEKGEEELAKDNYQEVLKLDPGNSEAREAVK